MLALGLRTEAKRVSVLPVVDDGKKLIRIIARKNIISAMAEPGF
jgi:CBS domain-containing protein